MPTFDYSSWAKLEPDFNEHIQSADPKVAYRAANALVNLLVEKPSSNSNDLPPEPVVAAVLRALRRHPADEYVQHNGCVALHSLSQGFPALRGALRRDPSVLATVLKAAAVEPILEESNWYTQELCGWLQPQAEEKGRHQSGYKGAQPGPSSALESGYPAASALPPSCDQGSATNERLKRRCLMPTSALETGNRSIDATAAEAKQMLKESIRQDLDVRETEWYNAYRQVVFKLLEDAEEDGATGMVLMSIKPKLEHEMTLQEWPALQSDLHKAFKNKNEPFFKGKQKEVVKFEKITTQQCPVKELREELLTTVDHLHMERCTKHG